MTLIEDLNWRYATKKFDPDRIVSNEDIDLLKEAISLAPSSYGLQPFEVLVMDDLATREKLKPAAWGQSQITDASHLFIFCQHTEVLEHDIDDYLKLKADTQGLDLSELEGFGTFMKNKLGTLPKDVIQGWTARQAYIALGNLLVACAMLKIDACPMEGFEPAEYNKILELSNDGLNAIVLVAVGYRSEEDQAQHARKVRKPYDKLFQMNRPPVL